MRSQVVAAALVTVAIAAGGGYWWYRSNNPRMLLACEKSLKERLVSPSGYRRVHVNYSQDRLTRAQFEERLYADDEPESIKKVDLRRFDSDGIHPTIFHALITYDAPNAFGTPLRGITDCTYYSENGDRSDASSIFVKVDGKDSTEWLIDAIHKSRAGGN